MTDLDFDSEPEDSWDVDDPIPECLANLLRRVQLLMMEKVLTTRAQERIRHLAEDLETLLERYDG